MVGVSRIAGTSGCRRGGEALVCALIVRRIIRRGASRALPWPHGRTASHRGSERRRATSKPAKPSKLRTNCSTNWSCCAGRTRKEQGRLRRDAIHAAARARTSMRSQRARRRTNHRRCARAAWTASRQSRLTVRRRACPADARTSTSASNGRSGTSIGSAPRRRGNVCVPPRLRPTPTTHNSVRGRFVPTQ